jgi:hypothetical protein
MHREDMDQAGGGENPLRLRLRRGQQHITASLPGLRPDTRERGQAAAVDELQVRQVDDDLALAGHQGPQRGCGTGRGGYVQLPAQHRHDPAAVPAGTQIHASHQGRLLLQQRQGLDPGGSSASCHLHTTPDAAFGKCWTPETARLTDVAPERTSAVTAAAE